ncbi:substance-P receptor-like [Mytilus galloprovincialis]|uniref:substance-P receptor-like n=1 Tax=Mytilus galloprovincialis TaxID=29158 RepID=UPI003F7C61B3
MAFSDYDSFKQHFNLTEKDIENIYQNLKNKTNIAPASSEIVIVLALLYGLISLVAVLGNGLVILVVLTKNNMQTLTNIFIANLACSDVALGIFVIPFQFQTAILQRWVVAEFMCSVAPFVKNLSVNVSVLSLTLIAIDRYIAVLHPLHAGFRKTVAIVVLLIIWLVSTLSAVPYALFHTIESMFKLKDLPERKMCVVKWPSENFRTLYGAYLIILQYVVPLSIITFSYIRITCRKWGNALQGNETCLPRGRARNTNRKKVVKMLIIVVCLFAFCWLPVQIYNLLLVVYKDKVNKFEYIKIIWLCSNWLAMSNACYNPFIYGLLNEKFKKEFKNLLTTCACCCKQYRKNSIGQRSCYTEMAIRGNSSRSLRTFSKP